MRISKEQLFVKWEKLWLPFVWKVSVQPRTYWRAWKIPRFFCKEAQAQTVCSRNANEPSGKSFKTKQTQKKKFAWLLSLFFFLFFYFFLLFLIFFSVAKLYLVLFKQNLEERPWCHQRADTPSLTSFPKAMWWWYMRDIMISWKCIMFFSREWKADLFLLWTWNNLLRQVTEKPISTVFSCKPGWRLNHSRVF